MTTTQTSTQQPSASTTTTFNTTPDIIVPRGDTKSHLTFYAPPADGSKPWNYVEAPPAGSPQRNYGEDAHEVTLHDIRGHEKEYDINTNGFGVLQNVASAMEYGDWGDEGKIKETYYNEVEKTLLNNVPGANRIFIFDHTIRRSSPDAKRAPVNRAHIDQTTASANARVTHHMGAEAPSLLQSRVRLINVWRPLKGPVVSNPLAYADSRSVPDSDIVGVEHRYPDRTGETAGVKFTEQGKWHYLSGMEERERVLLQCFDSAGTGARTPHSAFVDPRTREGWPGRESIEVRALVFG